MGILTRLFTPDKSRSVAESVCPPFDEPITEFSIDNRLQPIYLLVEEARQIDDSIPMPNAALVNAQRGYRSNLINYKECPKTKSGKKPRYGHEIIFSLYGSQRKNKWGTWYGGDDGAHGEIWYLDSGVPGKARIDIWLKHNHWHVDGRFIDGALHLGFLERSRSDCEEKRIYDYRETTHKSS
jgi:hypothetical protein